MKVSKTAPGALRLKDLKGLGPKSEEMLSLVGIHTVEQLKAIDPFEVYAQLKKRAPGTTLNMLYAMMGAIEDRPWQDIKHERKIEILLRLERMGIVPR